VMVLHTIQKTQWAHLVCGGLLSFHRHIRGNTSSLFAFKSLLVLAGDAYAEQVAY
jgi:hypothetical protein